MKNAFCLLNHKPTQKQIAELQSSFDTSQIVCPPTDVTEFWAQIPPVSVLRKNELLKVVTWLDEANEGDIVIIQGEFGATFALVDYALMKKLIPIYAVTQRIAQEQQKGETIHRQYIFEHVCFRTYSYYSNLAEE